MTGTGARRGPAGPAGARPPKRTECRLNGRGARSSVFAGRRVLKPESPPDEHASCLTAVFAAEVYLPWVRSAWPEIAFYAGDH
ncbi:hypothetical protein CVV65_12675 [Kyrpidia spormannii]|uniref:Uncharacterized protein n=1 Tax=Kyrpidia spormannii TaxID=2055160 RepID=A0A2K8N998_9BACL|nr:hypothetical protein CVV65_12675 [Kyrpidia spormannii]